jgi:hypothetical protein
VKKDRGKSIGLYWFYRVHRKEYKGVYDIDQQEYRRLVKLITDGIVKEITSGNSIKLPYNLGELYVYRKTQVIKPIDWHNTKKFGKYIYHLNLHSEGFIFKYRWNKTKGRFENKSLYKLRMNRVNTRALSKKILDNNIEIVRIK